MGRLRLVPRSPFLAIPVLSVIVLSLARPALAQVPDLETFRRELAQVLVDLDQQRAVLKQTDLVKNALTQSRFDSAPPLSAVQLQLQQMTYEDLARVHDAFATAFPRWREAPQVLANVVDEVRRQQSARKGTEVMVQGDIGIAAITPDNCQDAFNAAPSWTDWGVTKAFEIAAQGAYEIIPPPFNSLAMIAWIPLAEGANAAEILNLIFDRCSGDDAIADLATTLTDIQNSQTTIINNANSNTASILSSVNTAKTDVINNDNSNRAQITTAISTAQTNINTNTNTAATNIISNANTNTSTIVNNNNSNTALLNTAISNAVTTINNNSNANTAQLLRAHIEADLAEADNATPVAWYMTPTANGGHLDFVEEIVTQTLANIAAAGGNIGNAQALLDEGKALKAAGQFKDAYRAFRKAYKAAAN
jgi:hypothetical protein